MRKEGNRLLQLPCSHSSCLIPFIKENYIKKNHICTALKEKFMYFNVVSLVEIEKYKQLKILEGYNLQKNDGFQPNDVEGAP
jgi:hypothetical protein